MLKTLTFIICFSISIFSDSSHWDTHRPDSHAPIGIMGDHKHGVGKFMVSARQMSMSMSSLYNGTSEVSDSTALSNFTMIPTNMTMSMTMIGGMWAPSNKLTLMGMINYISNDMDMTNGMMSSNQTSEGFGDLKISAIYEIKQTTNDQWLFNSGISLPTGAIDESNNGSRLGYAMQLGSGTYDIDLGTSYTSQQKSLSYGAQAIGTFRLGENTNGYTLGNQYKISSWVQKPISSEWSASIRGTTLFINNISGSDSTLMASMSPSNSTEQGRIIADIGLGFNYYSKTGFLKGNRAAIEYNIPIYHHTNATQLTTESTLIFGIQKAI